MFRHVFTFTSAWSLLLCLAALSLWVACYGRGKSLYFSRQAHDGAVITYGIGSQAGSVVLLAAREAGPIPRGSFNRWQVVEFDESRVMFRNIWERIGFAWLHWEMSTFGITTSVRIVGLPNWLVAGIFALLPSLWIRARLKRSRIGRRKAGGMCVSCGYDLKGNASGICPECGTGCMRDIYE
ncbi:MAG TPA: hypothetical protein VFW23_09090 [Tepidisphaeraceae bacterium]|nr:hypothetical protein [Tepidisphaeraceae bacterium]